MSKSKKNTIDPEKIIELYGADSVRLFILSDSPPEKDVQWSDEGIASSYKFLQKLWTLNNKIIDKLNKDNKKDCGGDLEKFTHKFIKKITENLNNFSYNIVIANLHEMQSFMIKEIEKEYTKNTLLDNYSKILVTIQPIIPHFSSECLKLIKVENLIWPKFDEKIIEETEVNFVVQINGKKRGIINTNKEILEKDLFNLVKGDTKINKYIEDKKIIKTIFVPKKLINFIVKDV